MRRLQVEESLVERLEVRIPMKAATRSEGKRPAIPIESGHPPDRSEATTRGRSLGLCCTCFSVG